MATHRLLLLTDNLDGEAVAPFVPPGDWVQGRRFPRWRRVSEHALTLNIDLAFDPGHGRQWVIPCFSSTTAAPYAYRFTARAECSDGSCTPWRSISPIGDYPVQSIPTGAGSEVGTVFNTAIGAFFVKNEIRRLQTRLSVSTPDADALTRAPSLVSMSLSPNAVRKATHSYSRRLPVDIPVPARSQMVEPNTLRNRICAPTSVAMVMSHFGIDASTATLAGRAYHGATDRYGVWQENIRAASEWGVLGYVCRFPSWHAARLLMERGTPIIASIRYASGRLDNAPLGSTDGHLVTVCGVDGDAVKVNDPTGATDDAVYREYRLDQFEAAWIGSGGVGLVLFPLSSAASRDAASAMS